MDDLVGVAIVANEPEAELAVSVLRNEGIDAMWRTTDVAAGGLGPSGGAMGPVEILVRAADEERARELLA
jgi:hypothetical protein